MLILLVKSLKLFAKLKTVIMFVVRKVLRFLILVLITSRVIE